MPHERCLSSRSSLQCHAPDMSSLTSQYRHSRLSRASRVGLERAQEASSPTTGPQGATLDNRHYSTHRTQAGRHALYLHARAHTHAHRRPERRKESWKELPRRTATDRGAARCMQVQDDDRMIRLGARETRDASHALLTSAGKPASTQAHTHPRPRRSIRQQAHGTCMHAVLRWSLPACPAHLLAMGRGGTGHVGPGARGKIKRAPYTSFGLPLPSPSKLYRFSAVPCCA
jgi:hypothetical protein